MQPSQISDACEYLAWDSAFFEMRIARIPGCRLTDDSLKAALDWCSANQIRCLYFLAAADDRKTIALAQSANFDFVDIRVTLAVTLAAGREDAGPSVAGIRTYRQGDLDALKSIASRAHRDSRFFFDGRFSASSCELLYATWIEKSCRDPRQVVFVAEENGEASGYCTCSIDDAGVGHIGLLAVAEHARGRGLGNGLTSAALAHFRRQQVARVEVVTQGRNTQAARLYQKTGFIIHSLMLWYHKWFPL